MIDWSSGFNILIIMPHLEIADNRLFQVTIGPISIPISIVKPVE
jgi:hypothetical protein